ncbi:GA-like domain-containing protein [Empedobacter falsenii]
MDFDLKEKDENGNSKYLLNGVNAKIHFNTGDLAGYEFEIHEYNHETKEFHIIKFADENSYEFPSKDSDAFRISIGDEYVILDIQMPQSYIDNAEAELFEKADEYLSDKLEPNIQYLLDVDTLHLQRILNDTVTQFFSIGDFIKVVDEDFDINRYIRIKSIERDLRNPFDYKLTLSDSKVTNFLSGTIPGEINTIKNIIKINNLNNPAKARRNWKDAQEVLNMVFDVEGDYYTEKIKPNSIETTHLQVGAKSMQFNLIDSFFEPNFEGNPNKMRWSTCKLVHFTISDKIVDWQIQGGQKDLEANKPYYLYAKCNKANNIGLIEITETQFIVDQGNYYYFLIGIINTYSDDVKAREISLMYGFTTVSGRFIKTGRISSNDGSTYLDLDENIFKGRIEFANDSPAFSQIQVNIDKSKSDSISASKAYSDAQDELKRIQTEAYADGKVTAAEQRAIDDATGKAEAAKLFAAAQDNLLRVQLEAYADGQITVEEQERIQQMQDNLAAAKAYADAQAELARIIAAAYADGIVSEEEARAIAEAQAKLEEAKNHAQGLVNNIQIGGRNLLINSKESKNGIIVRIDCINLMTEGYYTFSFSNNAQNADNITVQLYDEAIGNTATGVPADIGKFLSVGQRYIYTINLLNNTKYTHFYINSNTNSLLDLKYFKLEKGNKSTDWTPAPEDVENAINDVKIKADQANQAIANIANDNILSPSEKQQVANEWNRIKSEYTSNYSLALSNGIATTNYTNAYMDIPLNFPV